MRPRRGRRPRRGGPARPQRQVTQARQDAARDQAGLRAAFEARIAAAEQARAALQARAEQAEAEAGEARAAAQQADARLTAALAAKAAAEQDAVAAHEAAQARVAQAERAAEDQAGQAESRARNAGQDAAQAREAAQAARAELDRAREAAGRQVTQARQDAARDQAGLRAAFEARIAAAEDARAALQARAEHAEAELQRARAEGDKRPARPPRDSPQGPRAAGAPREPERRATRTADNPPPLSSWRTSALCSDFENLATGYQAAWHEPHAFEMPDPALGSAAGALLPRRAAELAPLILAEKARHLSRAPGSGYARHRPDDHRPPRARLLEATSRTAPSEDQVAACPRPTAPSGQHVPRPATAPISRSRLPGSSANQDSGLADGQRLADAAGLVHGQIRGPGSGHARAGALAPLLLTMIEGC